MRQKINTIGNDTNYLRTPFFNIIKEKLSPNTWKNWTNEEKLRFGTFTVEAFLLEYKGYILGKASAYKLMFKEASELKKQKCYKVTKQYQNYIKVRIPYKMPRHNFISKGQ